MSIKPLAVAFGLCVLALGAGLAAAQTTEGRGRLSACKKDFDAFCANVERGQGRRLQCLKTNEASLSPECKTALEAAISARAAREEKGGAASKQ